MLSSADSRTFGVDGGDALGGADVPDADGLVARRRDKQIGIGRMPTELIYAVAVTPVVIFLHLGGRVNQIHDLSVTDCIKAFKCPKMH